MEIKNQDQHDAGLNSTGELNLYLDLLAFSELPPEEQLAYKERLKIISSEEILESAGEFPGFVEAAESTEEVSPSNDAIEPLLESLPEFAPPACEPLALLEPTEMNETVFEFMPGYEQPLTVEPDTADLPSEKTEPPATAVGATDLFRASGPLSLSGFLFDPTLKAASQFMPLAVCASCGSETDGDDLFCAECGDFMDEKAESQVSGPQVSGPQVSGSQVSGSACEDCGLIVTTGELICPACGSVSAVC